jgi:hypothetical protein
MRRATLFLSALWLLSVLLSSLTSGCGGGGQPEAATPAAPAGPPKTELQRRQEAACDALGPRLTACAYESAKQNLTEEQLKKEQVDEKVGDHTALIVEKCRQQQMSSRQVRVYEVCMREEAECAPLLDCLEHAKPQPVK